MQDEILGLLLDLEVRIADDPEGALPAQGIAREQPPGEQHDDLLDGDEAGGGVVLRVRQAHEAVEHRRQADEGAQGRPSRGRTSISAIVDPRFGMNGNGWAGSMASGVSTGKTWLRK